MGYAARANPLALTAGKDRDEVGMDRLRIAMSAIHTPEMLDKFLTCYHPEDREGIRAIAEPLTAYTLKGLVT